MKLTNNLRDAISRAICNDIPRTDYKEQIRTLVQAHYVKAAPREVQAVYKNPNLRGYLCKEQVHIAGCGYNYLYCVTPDADTYDVVLPDTALMEQLQALTKLNDEQSAAIYEASQKVRATVSAFRTTQALLKAYPEWEKYIPKEDAPTVNLPAHANLISDLVKLGWPDGGKPKA